VWSAFAAQHADIFGTRPSLSARIKLADQTYVKLAAFAANLLGPICQLRFGVRPVFYVRTPLPARDCPSPHASTTRCVSGVGSLLGCDLTHRHDDPGDALSR